MSECCLSERLVSQCGTRELAEGRIIIIGNVCNRDICCVGQKHQQKKKKLVVTCNRSNAGFYLIELEKRM